jgi:hypothetical protein
MYVSQGFRVVCALRLCSLLASRPPSGERERERHSQHQQIESSCERSVGTVVKRNLVQLRGGTEVQFSVLSVLGLDRISLPMLLLPLRGVTE